MTLPQARDIIEFWIEVPPENEMMALLAQVYTSWRPAARPMTETEHRASLEARWAAGAMNPKQLIDAMGGGGVIAKGVTPQNLPGIGPFPGSLH